MKNVLYILAVAGVVAFGWWAIPEGIERQAIVDCWKAKEICDKYWEVHQGNCLECDRVHWCYEQNLLK